MIKKIKKVSIQLIVSLLVFFAISIEANAIQYSIGTDSNGGKHYYVDGNEVSESAYHESRKNDVISQMTAKGYTYVGSMDELRNKAANMSIGESMSYITPFSISNDEFEQMFGINSNSRTYFNLAQYAFFSRSYIMSSKVTNEYDIYQISYKPEKLVKAEYDQCYGIANQVSQSLAGADRYGKIKGAFEWLCNNISYDSYSNHTLSSALIGRNTVCEGYAMSFQLMMNQMGIPCYIIVNADHAWNAVQMEDGIWYFVDATWGDQQTFIDYNRLLFGVDSEHLNTTPLNISGTKYNGPSSENVVQPQTTAAPETTAVPVETTTIEVTTEEETSTEEETTTVEETTEEETTITEKETRIKTTESQTESEIEESSNKTVVVIVMIVAAIAGISAIGGAAFFFIKK